MNMYVPSLGNCLKNNANVSQDRVVVAAPKLRYQSEHLFEKWIVFTFKIL